MVTWEQTNDLIDVKHLCSHVCSLAICEFVPSDAWPIDHYNHPYMGLQFHAPIHISMRWIVLIAGELFRK